MTTLFRNSIWGKALALCAVMLALSIPLAQVGWLVDERGASQRQARSELAATHAGPQTLVGPLLVLPYVERWVEEQRNDKGEIKARIHHARQLTHLVFPNRIDLRGTLAPEERTRGIFRILFYKLDAAWSGEFPAFDPASLARTEKNSTLETLAPMLAFGLQDVRGIQGLPTLSAAGEALRFEPRVPGVGANSLLANGIHAPLTGAALQAYERRQSFRFDMQTVIVGQERLAIAPVAGDTRAHLTSAWPHPSFGGQFLAAERSVTEQGFDARWAVSSLVSSARAQIMASMAQKGEKQAYRAGELDTFDLSLIQPQNPYSMTDRAVKYGALFIGLVLMAAFMFELLRGLRLHPVQYGLVGLSIALFFLLLLALSEKLDFGLAYLVAATASVVLLLLYFSAVLAGWRRALSLSAYVGLLYSALYGLLVSESNALLLGSLLAFCMLALLMLATRRVDWYAFSKGLSSPEPPAPTEEAPVPA